MGASFRRAVRENDQHFDMGLLCALKRVVDQVIGNRRILSDPSEPQVTAPRLSGKKFATEIQ
jgi:hypothetical protein